MSQALREMGRSVAEQLEARGPRLDESQGLARFREVVDAGVVKPRRRRARGLAAALAALVAVMLVALWLWPRKPLDFVLEGGQPAAVTAWIDGEEATAARFSDGSLVRGQAGSRWRVHATTSRGAVLQLERGALTADVTHRDDTDWQIDAGPFAVRVTGTSFTTRWDPVTQTFELAMHQGTVVLSGPIVGSRREVAAPEHLRIDLAGRKLSVVPHGERLSASGSGSGQARASDGAHDDAHDGAPERAHGGERKRANDSGSERDSSREPERTHGGASISAHSRESVRAHDSGHGHTAAGEHAAADPGLGSASGEPRDAANPSSWRAHATARRYPQALAAIREQGAAELMASAAPADLLLIAQVARLGGDVTLAGQALTALRARYPQSVQARTAQFLEGRMQFDRGKHAEAVATLSAYLAAAPGGAFAGEAQVLRILALHRAGRTDEARRRAKAYLQQNPTGPQADRIRSILTP